MSLNISTEIFLLLLRKELSFLTIPPPNANVWSNSHIYDVLGHVLIRSLFLRMQPMRKKPPPHLFSVKADEKVIRS